MFLLLLFLFLFAFILIIYKKRLESALFFGLASGWLAQNCCTSRKGVIGSVRNGSQKRWTTRVLLPTMPLCRPRS